LLQLQIETLWPFADPVGANKYIDIQLTICSFILITIYTQLQMRTDENTLSNNSKNSAVDVRMIQTSMDTPAMLG